MPRTEFLRFPFSSEDQQSIDLTSLQVDDIPYAGAPAARAPYPQSLRIRFQRKNGVTTPIQIRPLFPGALAFVRDDPAAPIPAPGAVTDAGNAYDAWPTRGTLMVSLESVAIQKHLRGQAPGLEVLPNLVWYSGVRLSRDFLFTSLRTELNKRFFQGKPSIGTARPDWWKHAISGFLAGKTACALVPKGVPEEDQALTSPMPVLEPVNGTYTLVITLGRAAGTPVDGLASRFATALPEADENDPANPRFGIVPARHVLRLWRASMVDGTGAVPDAVLREWPYAPRYFPVRCTRTWKPVPDNSVHFPRQRLRITGAGGAVVAEQRLAANGIFYLAQTPPAPLPEDPSNISPPTGLQLAVEGGMRWLDGSQPDCWRIPGGTAPIPLGFAAGAVPHVVLRLPMGQAMLPEDYFLTGDWRGCTYLSIRRTVRALVDNRIAGGRLNFQTKTKPPTLRLINQALGGNRASIVADNAPDPKGLPGLAAELIPILKAFFPGDAEPVAGCTPAPTADLSKGMAIYNIWQSHPDAWYMAGRKCYYPDEIVMRGSPGATYYAGIAGILDNLSPTDLATDPAVQQRLAKSIRDGNLQPGTLLQLWRKPHEVELARTRKARVVANGHSPVFLDYEYNQDKTKIIGIRYVDQGGGHGQSVYFNPDGTLGGPPIWFANTWNE